jgi:hypothetical protein
MADPIDWNSFLYRSVNTNVKGNSVKSLDPPQNSQKFKKTSTFKVQTCSRYNPYISKNKYIKSKISAALRRQVWETYIGKHYSGLCNCCKRTEINVFNFQSGHVVAEIKGGPTNLKNLRPICALCNYSSGTQHMFEFARIMGFQ